METYKIFYDDGSTYSPKKGDVFSAPGLGVICILDTHGEPHIDEKYDYYVWKFREDGWTGVDLFGLWDYLMQPGPRKAVSGRVVDNDTFERIHLTAYREMTR